MSQLVAALVVALLVVVISALHMDEERLTH